MPQAQRGPGFLDLLPGPPGGGAGMITPIDGVLYFLADDSTGGACLWRTRGTAAGTTRVSGLYFGGGGFLEANVMLAAIRPDGLGRGSIAGLNGALLITADNGTTGPEPWILDPMAPAVTVPADLTAEATSPADAAVSFEAAAADHLAGTFVPTCDPASGSTFPPGETSVACTVLDETGNPAGATFLITVRDTTAPTPVVPGDLDVSATGHKGAAVHFAPAATDLADASPSVPCAPASGSTSPVGTTTIKRTATDASRNAAQASFNVQVSAAPAAVDLGALSVGLGIGALLAAAAILALLRFRGKPVPASRPPEPPTAEQEPTKDEWDL